MSTKNNLKQWAKSRIPSSWYQTLISTSQRILHGLSKYIMKEDQAMTDQLFKLGRLWMKPEMLCMVPSSLWTRPLKSFIRRTNWINRWIPTLPFERTPSRQLPTTCEGFRAKCWLCNRSSTCPIQLPTTCYFRLAEESCKSLTTWFMAVVETKGWSRKTTCVQMRPFQTSAVNESLR